MGGAHKDNTLLIVKAIFSAHLVAKWQYLDEGIKICFVVKKLHVCQTLHIASQNREDSYSL